MATSGKACTDSGSAGSFTDLFAPLDGNALAHDIARGMEAGFFRYLTKPIKLKEFMAALDAALVIGETAS